MKNCPRTGKRRFHDHAEAIKALKLTKSKTERATVPLRVYECPLCKGWHFTSQEFRPGG